MQALDEEMETIHLYVVRGEEKRPYTAFPLFCAFLCLLGIVAVTLYSAEHPYYDYERLTVPAEFLPLKVFKTETTIIPTGIKTYPATTAHGILTLTNGSVVTEQLPQGMIFTSKHGTEVVTDSPVLVPAGSASTFGMSTVPAHLLTSGINMSTLDIDQVLGTSLYIRNLYPFTGGKPAYSTKFITSQDKQIAFDMARASLAVQKARTHAILATPCREASSTSRIVQLTWVCQFVAYPHLPGMRISAIRLRGKNLLVDVAFVAPPRRVWAK